MFDLSYLEGKTIDHIDSSEHDEFVLVHFTDGSMWLVVARVWNCSGASLLQRLSFGPGHVSKKVSET